MCASDSTLHFLLLLVVPFFSTDLLSDLYLLVFVSSSTRPFLGEICYSFQCLKGKYKQRTLQMRKIFVVILFLTLPKECHCLSSAGPSAASSGRAHLPEWHANSTVSSSELCLGWQVRPALCRVGCFQAWLWPYCSARSWFADKGDPVRGSE